MSELHTHKVSIKIDFVVEKKVVSVQLTKARFKKIQGVIILAKWYFIIQCFHVDVGKVNVDFIEINEILGFKLNPWILKSTESTDLQKTNKLL